MMYVRGKEVRAGCFSRLSKRYILFISILILSVIYAYPIIPDRSRHKFDVAIGYGFPESICLKLNYGNNFQTGISQSIDTHGLGPSALELYYRFGEKPRLLDQKPWYIFLGGAGYIFDVDYKEEYTFLLYPRIGRSFEFTKNSGARADIGPGVPFGRDTGTSNPISPVLLTGSICLYLRF